LRIVRVSGEKDLVGLYAFRYRIFVEELGWMARKDHGAHILVDEFDRDAVNYAAYDDSGEVIGSVRAVPDGPLGLPLERCRVLDGYRDDKRLVELSRLAAAPEWRRTRLAALLMKAGYQCAESLGATHLVIDSYVGNGQGTDRLYLKMGFRQLAEAYPDPDYLWKQSVVTLALDCDRARTEWQKRLPGLSRFFAGQDDRIDHGAPQDLESGWQLWPADRAPRRRRRPVTLSSAAR
jgi:N-acyl-L-homoserine lactone synthetase